MLRAQYDIYILLYTKFLASDLVLWKYEIIDNSGATDMLISDVIIKEDLNQEGSRCEPVSKLYQ